MAVLKVSSSITAVDSQHKKANYIRSKNGHLHPRRFSTEYKAKAAANIRASNTINQMTRVQPSQASVRQKLGIFVHIELSFLRPLRRASP